jgi:hypothetical protein
MNEGKKERKPPVTAEGLQAKEATSNIAKGIIPSRGKSEKRGNSLAIVYLYILSPEWGKDGPIAK